MSDSIKKYYEMIEDGWTPSPISPVNSTRSKAYRLLCEYPEEIIIEAYNILKKINE